MPRSHQALSDFLEVVKPAPLTVKNRLVLATEQLAGQEFSRKDYLKLFKMIATATASRDLKEGVDRGILRKIGDKARAVYCVEV